MKALAQPRAAASARWQRRSAAAAQRATAASVCITITAAHPWPSQVGCMAPAYARLGRGGAAAGSSGPWAAPAEHQQQRGRERLCRHHVVCAAGANLYDVLGVAQASSAAEIKSAFRRLALRLHPDVCSDVRPCSVLRMRRRFACSGVFA
jgi:hypothetical protein